MKAIKFFIAALLPLSVFTLNAQTDLQNTGILNVTSSLDILYVSGSFTNASGSAFTNNGNLYVLQNLINNQSSMAAGTGTLYLNGSAVQAVGGAQFFKTFNLVTNNGSGITLNNDLSVSGAHTFTAGIITSSATPNYLMYEAGSSYSGDGDTKHVKGWVRKSGTTAFTFPLGNGTAERTIATGNLSASSVFNANYAGPTSNITNIAGPLVAVDPYESWIVNELSGGTATINMNWDNSKIAMPTYALADIRVANYQTGLWSQAGGSASGNVITTGTITSNTLSFFGPFTFGSISFSLPVNLLDFRAYKNNNDVLVSWTTSDEINVRHYDVQRSDDAIVFYNVGSLAARNSPGIQQYTFTDTKFLQALTYYRLRSVDTDGKTQLSKTVTVNNTGTTDVHLFIANPARGSIWLNMQNMNGVFAYRLNTVGGQTAQTGSINVTAPGLHEIRLSDAVRKGYYVLQIEKAGFVFSQKILIQ